MGLLLIRTRVADVLSHLTLAMLFKFFTFGNGLSWKGVYLMMFGVLRIHMVLAKKGDP